METCGLFYALNFGIDRFPVEAGRKFRFQISDSKSQISDVNLHVPDPES